MHLIFQARKMICPICPRRFKDEISMKQHLVMFHREVEYCCPRCNKSFDSYSNMVLHQDSHSTLESLYCIRCNRSFTSRPDYHKHLRLHGKFLAHEINKQSETKDSKPFGCVKCKQLRISKSKTLLDHYNTICVFFLDVLKVQKRYLRIRLLIKIWKDARRAEHVYEVKKRRKSICGIVNRYRVFVLNVGKVWEPRSILRGILT